VRHNKNRRPYELRIYDKCGWHTLQGQEHVLLDCPHELLDDGVLHRSRGDSKLPTTRLKTKLKVDK
jgi:hypothetical protein